MPSRPVEQVIAGLGPKAIRTKASGGTSVSGETAATGGGAASATSCALPTLGSRGTNPLFTDVFTADPAPMVHDRTFYITSGHDEGAGDYFTTHEWFLLKSTDMVHWTRSLAMRYTIFSWAHGNAWAGQLVAKGGKFYWFTSLDYGDFPYCNGITTKVTGWAVKAGQRKLGCGSRQLNQGLHGIGLRERAQVPRCLLILGELVARVPHMYGG